MFGSFDIKSFLFLLFIGFACASGALESAAPAEANSSFAQGKIISNGASVYKSADFDSPVLGKLGAGKIYDIFPKPFGAFYRIKVGKVYGYVADSDIQIQKTGSTAPSVTPAAAPPAQGSELEPKKKVAPKKSGKLHALQAGVKKRHAFAMTRYLGFSFSSNSYKEDTLGDKRSEAAPYFGVKLSGPDVLLEGEAPSEINIQVHSGAPSYYEKMTGVSGGGLIYLMDFQILSVTTLSPVVLSWFGFGPIVRYAKFELGLKDPATGKVTGYNAEDIAIGVVFSLGLGFRMGNFALRPEFKYYWEKEQYWGAGAAFQFEF